MFYRYSPRFFDAFRRAMSRPLRTAYPGLMAWALETRTLVSAVYHAAHAAGWTEDRRRALRLRVDRRDVSMETVLAAVRHHAGREYESLLARQSDHGPLAVRATNLNDRYLVQRLAGAPELQAEPLRSRLQALSRHLDAIPPEDE